MASIDSVLNAYLDEEGFDWQPEVRVVATETEAGGLPVTRRKWQSARYSGTLAASFPTRALYASFLSFWSTNRNLPWTWTCPDDNVVYTCKFLDDKPGYRREGPEEFRVSFRAVGRT